MQPDYTAFDRLTEVLSLSCTKNEPMSAHTTFRIGGPADRFLSVKNKEELSAVLKALEDGAVPWYILGKGSNLLVSDLGIRGTVISLEGQWKDISLLPDGKTVCAGAAVPLSVLCAFARDHSLSGLEFAWGIPGSVGGAVYMDAGAYGGEMRDVVAEVTHLTPDGALETVKKKDLDFGYRHSRYSDKRDIILSAQFQLEPGNRNEIAAKMEELMNRRKEKQPYDMPSAGSTFKRPKNGYAAALIEECGLKGRQIGGAQVSPKHAGFIVNTGGATCEDVLQLVREIQQTVEEKTGIRLECEVRVTGEPQ